MSFVHPEAKIGNNVKVGPFCVIGPNVTIGDDCAIGANAVVTKNMPGGTVAVGVNARLLNLTGDDLYVI